MKFIVITLTEANIEHSHIYLSSHIGFFSENVIGGANKSSIAEQLLQLNFGLGGDPVYTDIAGDKNIFRKRGWVKTFFKIHELEAGDSIVIEKIDELSLHIYPSRH